MTDKTEDAASLGERIKKVESLIHAYADAKLIRYGLNHDAETRAKHDPDAAFKAVQDALVALAPQAQAQQADGGTAGELPYGFESGIVQLLNEARCLSKETVGNRELAGRIVAYIKRHAHPEAPAQASVQRAAEVAVWFGSMPESNGRENWTVTLRRKSRPQDASASDLHRLMSGVSVYRSEYKDRARYAADRLRHLLGEIDKAPNILDYDADLHSGYSNPTEAPSQASAQPVKGRVELSEQQRQALTCKNDVYIPPTTPQPPKVDGV